MKATHLLGLIAVVLVGTAVAQQATQAPVAATAATPTSSAPAATPAPTATPAPIVAVKEGPTKPGDPKAGAQKAGVCAACHGVDGNSADPINPRIAGQHERYIARQLAMFKSGERVNPIMQPQAANLSAQDMRDIGAYFATQKPQNAGVADESVIKAGPYADMKYYEVGQKIYRSGRDGVAACVACHGPTGRGNPGPSYPSITGQHASYTQAKLSEFRNGLVWGKGDNAKTQMADIAKRLTEEEVAALATYLQGLHDVRDNPPVAKK